MKNWTIEVKPKAVKQYKKLDKPTRARIKTALMALETSKNPFLLSNVKNLTGEFIGDYRVRVGNWRVFFTPNRKEKILYVFAILPRGDAY